MTATELRPDEAAPAAGRPPAGGVDGPAAASAAASAAAPAAAPRSAGRPPAQRAQRQAVIRAATGTIALAGSVLLGFAVFLLALSGLSESRSQNIMYKHFATVLRNAVAPVGPAAAGTPVAVLDIPKLGIVHLVVVEGTRAAQLTGGPGHRRDTPLPGQGGVSVVYGRRATFGAPFADLDRLRVHDLITVVTGQGTSQYAVRAFGGGSRPPRDAAANRLVLVTADASLLPSSTLSVSADLVTKPQPSPGGVRPAVDASEAPMRSGSAQAVVPLMLWGQALLIVAVVATVAVRRWSKWPAYIGLLPVALAVLWNVYENAALVLPNLY